MKFAKELEQELVPEWRAKYLNYKLGKKKIKAISRALQKVNRTPPRRNLGEYRDSPHDLPPNTSTSVTRFPLDFPPSKDGSAAAQTPTQSHPAAAPVSEQRPLRTPGSRFSNIVTSYGSIVSEPPNTAASDLPSLTLPDPAIDPKDANGSMKGLSEGVASSTLPRKDSLPKAGSGRSPRERSYSLLQSGKDPFVRRGSSLAEEAFSRKATFFRRVFTSGDLGSPSKSFQSSVYPEIDRKQDEFFDFLDDELAKIESFYRQKEQEATDRLKVLRQQLHMMRDQRTAEVLAAKRAASHDGHGHANGHGFIPGSKLTQIVSKPRFGKNSRALADLRTPLGPVPADLPDSVIDRRDFVRRPESPAVPAVPYRTAKRKLKQALQEYYRGLELLKAYAYLNRKAFRKINKKYDKVVNMRPTLRYMSDKVNHAYFVQSEVIEGHMVVVEDLYARYFERGNRKIAVGKLRGKNRPDDFSPNTFRAGLLIAAGVVCCVQGLIQGIRFLNGPDPTVQVQTSYLLQIYGGYFLIVFHFLLFCLDCMIWSKTKINYTFVFEFDTRHVLDWRQLSELPCFFFLLLGLFMWLNFSWVNDMFLYWPVVLIFITVVVLFLPARVLYHHSRKWWAFSNWRLLLAGLYPVEFRDFFLGDMYCSQTYAMGNVELFFCLYATHWTNPPVCNSSHSRLLGFFSTVPSIWRGFQCLRRYRDTKNVFPHLVNFGKYMFGILYYMTLSMYRIHQATSFQVIFIVFAFINAAYASVWDLAMDWSLCNPYAPNPFLRELLAFRKVWIYYVAMVMDVVVRFNWIFYAIFAHDVQHSALLSFFVALSEICRRGMWTVFRVENEHCTNVHLFRALRDIPLPYHVPLPSSAGDCGPAENAVPLQEQAPPTPAATTTRAADLESATLPTATPSLRARRPSFAGTITRVGNLMATAHSQDFQRKRLPDPLSGTTAEPETHLEESTDEEEDDEMSTPSRSEEGALLEEELPSPAACRDTPR
ncbi:hypothetical protein VTN77DRAFT_2775 [Rasamsonia byssochlamydoides]|uniref:uncharacterized protein n=1 Tax=Rasamsonia byssochlamydoides TaxID=89139 RepID=UPI003741F000